MDRTDILNFLGFMRKGGFIAAGAEETAEKALVGKVKLIVLADDISANTAKWMASVAEQKEVSVIHPGFTKAEMGGALGIGECAALAACDTGLAITLSKKLEMPELTQQLELKLEREKRRKAKKLAGKSKANNTRRGK